MRALLLIFGLVGCVGVVSATARYGMLTSDNHTDGYISAGLFSFVALAGLAGHAVAVRIWRHSVLWSLIIGMICFGAMAVSLTNSIGFVALRGSQGQEQVAEANKVIARAQAELSTLQRQREAKPVFSPATADQVKAAKNAVTTTTGVREAECVKRGPFCRDREADEQAAIGRLVAAESNLAATLDAADLDAQIKAIRSTLKASGAERTENPQGRALAALFRLPAAEAMTASTIQQALLAIILEVIIVACFVAHELLGREVRASANRPKKLGATGPPTTGMTKISAVESTPPKELELPKLVASTSIPIGAPSRFYRSAATPNSKSRTSVATLLVAYRSWCYDEGLLAVSADDFVSAIGIICSTVGIETAADGEDFLLIGVQLKRSPADRQSKFGG